MAAKGYLRLEDFRGKLKPYERPAKKLATVAVEPPAGPGVSYVAALHVLVTVLAALVIKLGWADVQRLFE